MIFLVLSVLLFGLVHPLSKLFLDSGLPLSFFCLSYIGIRLFVQAPVLFSSGLSLNSKPKVFIMLGAYGLLGAALQLFEFKGIEQGLPPGTVTFLVFSYPLWLALFSAVRAPHHKLKYMMGAVLSISGAFLVLGSSVGTYDGSILVFIYPLLASLCMALWILLAGKIRNEGFQAMQMSALYDLVSFVVLSPFLLSSLQMDSVSFFAWMSSEKLIALSLYSVLCGLAPNILFYHGSKLVPAYTAGMLMAIEPVISTVYSSLIWDDSLTWVFLLGAAMILLTNLPVGAIWKRLTLALFVLIGSSSTALSRFDCLQPRPEMPGQHNMVMFGDPNDQLYAYHLPLFEGEKNGQGGHALMHVYQAIWSVGLDGVSSRAYQEKFLKEKTVKQPVPFFSFSPVGKRFRLPEMICSHEFVLDAKVVYGHIEGNPAFPSPEPILNQLSQVEKTNTIFARRFDGSGKAELTYLIFGKSNHLYLVHYLTDDDNSFDQILSIEIDDQEVKEALVSGGAKMLAVPVENNTSLQEVAHGEQVMSPNNRWKISSDPGSVVQVYLYGLSKKETFVVRVLGEVYFNANSDLKVK